MPTSSFTAATDLSIIVCSSALSLNSITFSTPPAPSTVGTPTKYPFTPNSPFRYTQHGRTRFWSFRIDSTMASAADAGEKKAEPVFSRATTSPPAFRVRFTIASMTSFALAALPYFRSSSSMTGIPATEAYRMRGTMSSP